MSTVTDLQSEASAVLQHYFGNMSPFTAVTAKMETPRSG